MEDRFTEAELAIAKSVDLTAVASYLGYTVRKWGIIIHSRKWTLSGYMIRVTGFGGQGSTIRVRMAGHR